MDFNKKIIDIAIKNYMIIYIKITKNKKKKKENPDPQAKGLSEHKTK